MVLGSGNDQPLPSRFTSTNSITCLGTIGLDAAKDFEMAMTGHYEHEQEA